MEKTVSFLQFSLEITPVRPFHKCSSAKLYNDHIDLSAVPLSSLSWCAEESQFNERNLMCGSIMLSSTPLLSTIKKLALLIIANVLQWKCQCGFKAYRCVGGGEVLFALVKKLVVKYLLLMSATAEDRYGFMCGTPSPAKVCLTPSEHIRWNFNAACGENGPLHLCSSGGLWECIGIFHLL